MKNREKYALKVLIAMTFLFGSVAVHAADRCQNMAKFGESTMRDRQRGIDSTILVKQVDSSIKNKQLAIEMKAIIEDAYKVPRLRFDDDRSMISVSFGKSVYVKCLDQAVKRPSAPPAQAGRLLKS